MRIHAGARYSCAMHSRLHRNQHTAPYCTHILPKHTKATWTTFVLLLPFHMRMHTMQYKLFTARNTFDLVVYGCTSISSNFRKTKTCLFISFLLVFVLFFSWILEHCIYIYIYVWHLKWNGCCCHFITTHTHSNAWKVFGRKIGRKMYVPSKISTIQKLDAVQSTNLMQISNNQNTNLFTN